MSQTSCCVPGCTVVRGQGLKLHWFPNPNDPEKIERFRTWIFSVGGEIVGLDNLFIYKNRRVCHKHFEAVFTYSNQRINGLAVPTLHMPGSTAKKVRMPLSEINKSPASNPPLHSSNLGQNVYPKPSTSTALHEDTENESSAKLVRMPLSEIKKSPASNPLLHSSNLGQDVAPKPSTSTALHEDMENVAPVCVEKAKSKTEIELRNIISAIKLKMRRCQKKKQMLKNRLKLANNLQTSAAVKRLCNRLSPAALTFFHIQMEQFGKKPKGRRFSLEEKILALSIYKPSPKAYRMLSEIVILPKKRTLDKLMHKIQMFSGINQMLMKHLKKRVDKMPEHNKYCTVIFDEMALAAGVSFDRTNDVIHGFVDDGIDRTLEFSDHVLVFMVRGIHQKFKQPVTFTFCAGTTKTYYSYKINKKCNRRSNEYWP